MDQETKIKVLSKVFNKFIRDELSAASVYIKLSELVTTPKLAEELKEHAKEEFEHFQELMHFASAHGFIHTLNISLDSEAVCPFPGDDIRDISDLSVIRFVQDLETTAINDYKRMATLAMDHRCIEVYEFFSELMKDEMEHFDDLAALIGQTRPV